MPKAIPTTEQKETPMQFLTRNLSTATEFLPDSESRHLNSLRYNPLPVILGGVHSWQGFLQFVWSWQPANDGTMPESGTKCLGWSVGLNHDQREEDEVLKEMEKVLFLCHYLNAMITSSKIAIAWSKLNEGNPGKTDWLYESEELKDALESLGKADQWKEVMQIGIKMRELLRAMH